jgi:hypothetical protein
MKKAVWKEMFKFIQNNSDEELHHIDLNDPQIMKQVFSDGNWSFFVGVIMLISCLDEELAATKFFNTKVVEFCNFNPKDFSNMMIKFSLSPLVSCGKVFKSNIYNKKHPRVNVGQWSQYSLKMDNLRWHMTDL